MARTPDWSTPNPGEPGEPAGWTSPGSGGPGDSTGWSSPGEPLAGDDLTPPPPSWGGGVGGPDVRKPGVIPLRPLAVGEILDGALATIRLYPKATLGFAAIIATVTNVILFFIERQTLGTFDPETGAGLTDQLFARFASGAIQWTTGLVLAGMLTAVMGQAVLGRPVTLGQAWATVRQRFGRLLLAALLAGFIMFGGLLLCIIPGVYFYVALSVITPALVLEGQPVTKSLRRSMDLIKDAWWRTFGVLLLAMIISTILTTVIALFILGLLGPGIGSVFGGDESSLTTAVIAWNRFAAIVASTVVGPFSAGVTALIYVDRRMRLEGLDVTLAEAARTPYGDGA